MDGSNIRVADTSGSSICVGGSEALRECADEKYSSLNVTGSCAGGLRECAGVSASKVRNGLDSEEGRRGVGGGRGNAEVELEEKGEVGLTHGGELGGGGVEEDLEGRGSIP